MRAACDDQRGVLCPEALKLGGGQEVGRSRGRFELCNVKLEKDKTKMR